LAAAKREKRPRRRTEPARTVRVDSLALKVALDLAGGDLRRIRIISATEVQVRNS
jgi:hypothetical protein